MARVELVDSGTHEFSKDGITAVRRFKCDWSTRFLDAPVLGEPFPDIPPCRCIRVSFDPFKPDEASVVTNPVWRELPYSHPEFCLITAEYSTRQITVDMLPVESFRLSGEMIEIGTGAIWDSDGAVSEQSQAVFMPTAEYIVRVKVPEATWMAFKDTLYAGIWTVNQYPWKGLPAQCCMFNGCSADQEYYVENGIISRVYAVTYSFVYKSIGYNTYWRADLGDWDCYRTPFFGTMDFAAFGLGS